MAIIITIANKKGGVAKTTTALNLCDGLSRCQRNVLMIDMDPQCNSTASFGAEYRDVPSIFDLFMGKIETEEAIQQTIFGDIIPGDPEMSNYAEFFLSMKDRYNILKRILKDVNEQYEYIVIDTPGDFGLFTKNALAVSNGVILPIKAEKYSVDGLKDMIPTIDIAREEINPNLKLLGVLLVMYDMRTALDRDIWEYLKETEEFPVFSSPIRICQKVKEAQAEGASIFDLDPSGNASIDYAKLTTEVIRMCEQ